MRKVKVGTSPSQDEISAQSTVPIFRRRHPDDMDLKCVFCYFVRRDNPQPAITVMNGQAVCDDHTYYVQGGEFTRILRLVAGDELRSKG